MAHSHGPGPWVTDEAEHDCPHQDIVIRDADGSSICKVFIDDAPVPDYNARQYANARLLRAAPQMANLLHELNNWLVCGAIAPPEDMAQSFGSFQQQIEELLTAATGAV